MKYKIPESLGLKLLKWDIDSNPYGHTILLRDPLSTANFELFNKQSFFVHMFAVEHFFCHTENIPCIKQIIQCVRSTLSPIARVTLRGFVFLNFASFDKILCFYHSKETSLVELLQDAIYFSSLYKNEFGLFASRLFFLATLGSKVQQERP